jgi:hypothetical protein
VRHVAALAVGYHQQPGLTRGVGDLLERPPPRRAEALEAGKLELDRDDRLGGRRDQLARSADTGLNGGRVRVEAKADLAAALRNERREPVGKRDRVSRP